MYFRLIKSLAGLGLVFFILFQFRPIDALACSCAITEFDEEWNRSSAVFTGKVIEIKDLKANEAIQSSDDPVAVLFEVDEAWKGVSQSQVIVYTARDSASCGYEFSQGKEYLVYAQERLGKLEVSLCSRTAAMPAEEDLKLLGEGETSLEQVSLKMPSSSWVNWIWIIGSVAVVGIGVVLLYKKRK